MMSQTAHQCSSALGWLEDNKYFPREIPGFSGVSAVISAKECCPVNWAAANEWKDCKGMKHSIRKYIHRCVDIDLEVIYNHWSLPCSTTIISLPTQGTLRQFLLLDTDSGWGALIFPKIHRSNKHHSDDTLWWTNSFPALKSQPWAFPPHNFSPSPGTQDWHIFRSSEKDPSECELFKIPEFEISLKLDFFTSTFLKLPIKRSQSPTALIFLDCNPVPAGVSRRRGWADGISSAVTKNTETQQVQWQLMQDIYWFKPSV